MKIQLSAEMARIATSIKQHFIRTYAQEASGDIFHRLFGIFKATLINDLNVEDFADLYAQTIALGLFFARIAHEDDFTKQSFTQLIPNSTPFLKHLFAEFSSNQDHPDDFDFEDLGVNDLLNLLQMTDVDAIIKDFNRLKKGEDPVIHFYEDFIKVYNPTQKTDRGVFYTPDSVVSFIVRSIHQLLKTEFQCANGLADDAKINVKISKEDSEQDDGKQSFFKIQILDPATGTGTFLQNVVQVAKAEFGKIYGETQGDDMNQAWNEYLRLNLLPRLFGFEIMLAPYAIAHLKLGLELLKTNYRFDQDQRLGVYLTNTLEDPNTREAILGSDLDWLTEEEHEVSNIKNSKIISVVIGNPPYKGHSVNNSHWIKTLLKEYQFIDGEELFIPQKKWLQNDYVKFIRFGEWRIEQTGFGILGYITDHSYLDGDTFPGMRHHLLQTFDLIYILNLHGNRRRNEVPPDGEADGKVFDIEEGVAILFGVKYQNVKAKRKKPPARVFYHDCWGSQDKKSQFLIDNDVGTIDWAEIFPLPPRFLFIGSGGDINAEFNGFPSIPQIFSQEKPAEGFITTQDDFALAFSETEIQNHVITLLHTETEQEARQHFQLCRQDQWNYENAKAHLTEVNWEENIIKCLYRPFDYRFSIYDSQVLVHRRERVSSYLLEDWNLGLVTTRMTKGQPFRHVFVTSNIAEASLLSSKTSTNAFLFPLYRVNPTSLEDNPSFLNPTIIGNVAQDLGLEYIPQGRGDFVQTIGTEDILGYIYAILHAPAYRNRYDIFLQRDYPHIPFTKHVESFRQLAALGTELVALHLMRVIPPNNLGIVLNGEGNNNVSTVPSNRKPLPSISAEWGSLSINDNQAFEPVPQTVWALQIGSYFVCHKWLDYRRGRNLSSDNINHFINIVLVCDRMIAITEEINRWISAEDIPQFFDSPIS